MSGSGDPKHGFRLTKLDELEEAVQRALRQLEIWRERALASEAERRELEEKLGDLQSPSGHGDPAEILNELERLREENRKLRGRLEEGRRRAEEIARQVEFLEDTR